MPYSASNPPSKTKTLTAKGRRQWTHVFNKVTADGKDEGAAHRMAWGAVRNAGNRKDQQKDAATLARIRNLLIIKRAIATLHARKSAAAQPQASSNPYGPDNPIAQGIKNWMRRGYNPGTQTPAAPAPPPAATPPSDPAAASGGVPWGELAAILPGAAGAGGLLYETLKDDEDDDRGMLARYGPWAALLGAGGYGALRLNPSTRPDVLGFEDKLKGLFKTSSEQKSAMHPAVGALLGGTAGAAGGALVGGAIGYPSGLLQRWILNLPEKDKHRVARRTALVNAILMGMYGGTVGAVAGSEMR